MSRERRRHEIHDHTIEVLIDEEQIAQAVERLGQQITKDYDGQELLLVVILKGATTFNADLQRAIDPTRVRLTTDYMAVSSYGSGTESSRAPVINSDLQTDIEGKHVLFVEDIADTRYSLELLQRILSMRKPASLKTCVLLDKNERKETDATIDYVGFIIPDKFVIGYGLDLDQYFRELPFVGVVVKEPN